MYFSAVNFFAFRWVLPFSCMETMYYRSHRIIASRARLCKFDSFLTLPALCISESCIKMKITEIFIFILLCGASKSFIKALKAPQRSVKIKILVNFLSFKLTFKVHNKNSR